MLNQSGIDFAIKKSPTILSILNIYNTNEATIAQDSCVFRDLLGIAKMKATSKK